MRAHQYPLAGETYDAAIFRRPQEEARFSKAFYFHAKGQLHAFSSFSPFSDIAAMQADRLGHARLARRRDYGTPSADAGAQRRRCRHDERYAEARKKALSAQNRLSNKAARRVVELTLRDSAQRLLPPIAASMNAKPPLYIRRQPSAHRRAEEP